MASPPDPPPPAQTDPVKPPVREEVAREVQPVAAAIAQQLLNIQFSAARDPLVEKMTPEHLSQAMKAKEKREGREHELAVFKAWFDPLMSLIGVVTVVLLIIGLCWLFLYYQKSEKLELVLGLILGFAAGGASGYSFAKRSSAKDDPKP